MKAMLALEDFNKLAKSIAKAKVSWMPLIILLPIICAVIVGLWSKKLELTLISSVIVAVFGGAFYSHYFDGKFSKIKGQFKQLLLRRYMEEYYPEIDYVYRSGASKASSYIRYSTLVPAVSEFAEEDVIEGSYDEFDFYLSQIWSVDGDESATSKSKKNVPEDFQRYKGMLIELRSPKFDFPETTIRSKAGFLRKTFEGYKFHEKYQFAYKTEDEEKLAEATAEIIPFIAYLKAKHKDVKILLNGDRILMMLSTDMDFLDEPNLSLGDDFRDEKYYHGMTQHLNSMFFILESLIGKETPLELEEKLALRVKKKLLG